MKKLHSAILDKRTRYDLYINIEKASRLEQLSEAMEMSKSEVAEIAIDLLYTQKSSLIKAYLLRLEEMKKELKDKTQRTLNLFDFDEVC
ncbi:hypothetical protein [Campylobacter hyointestinalis]|uniref:hypothetical protein n=1 Tax=Campylobacter hyointestinalis TaxID=198 RepID=UPI00072AA9BD|nr:hypothetical protein [Campylobacter hyointestinalis]PPB63109.1 hypothetical protein CDQ72_01550 [Campylobacter hyointestinalis subsp. hyointestinalis]PPB65379.1 hypothetical protein CDQ73_01300 [Campylobacter hyointestinalis subsp. hyointestinalis]CUU72072.1 Uncharacterised protein [Campylobacter hyointestinalis subsp. hyointestinalis]